MNRMIPTYPRIAWFFAAIFAAITCWLAMQAPEIAAHGAQGWHVAWIPSLNIAFDFRLDGLALVFAGMISAIGACIFLYASAYMRSYAHSGRFFTILALFAFSMLGLVLADHVLLLFIFWEGTSITSFLLIGFQHEKSAARRNALQAMLVTTSAGLVMFAGLVWMGIEAGSFLLSDILAAPELILISPYSSLILLGVLIGCFAKSAQIPFHFWLPNAMSAPTPISAYLHSATMVKAGIYLLARLQPALSLHDWWLPLLAIVGGATAIWGSLLAFKQEDLKQVLAYTTLMALGTLVFMLAFPTRAMTVAMVSFLLAHALYKATLFMVVGGIESHAGTRNWRELSGLRTTMPCMFVFALLAAGSMAGLFPLFGFVAKEAAYTAGMGTENYQNAVLITLMIANMLMVAITYRIVLKPFLGKPMTTRNPLQPIDMLLVLPAAITALACVFAGLAPTWLGNWLILPAASDIFGFVVQQPLALWHGVNTPLLLSVLTLGVGAVLMVKIDWLSQLIMMLTRRLPSMDWWYDKKLALMEDFGRWLLHGLHHGVTPRYAQLSFAVVAAVLLAVIYQAGIWSEIGRYTRWWSEHHNYMALSLCAFALLSATLVIFATTRIMALASLGASGFAMAGIFLFQGALDVAMTQLLVETLVVVLAAAAFWRLPELSATGRRVTLHKTNLLIALAMGAAVALTLLGVLTRPLDLSVTHFYENASLPLAHGRNIVNVILVDFRAFDTFGETMVVAIAAFGLWALMRPVARAAKEVTP